MRCAQASQQALHGSVRSSEVVDWVNRDLVNRDLEYIAGEAAATTVDLP
jgi:hypothetical protein